MVKEKSKGFQNNNQQFVRKSTKEIMS